MCGVQGGECEAWEFEGRTVKCGVWSGKHGVRSGGCSAIAKCGAWSGGVENVKCGAWRREGNSKCGVWSVGVERVGFGVQGMDREATVWAMWTVWRE